MAKKNRKAAAKRYGEKKAKEHYENTMCSLLGIEKEDIPLAIARLLVERKKENSKNNKQYQVF